MTELKPCPFCGSKKAPRVMTVAECDLMDSDDSTYEWSSKHFTVVCSMLSGGCGASVKANNETEEEAIEEWNRRTEPPTNRNLDVNGFSDYAEFE